MEGRHLVRAANLEEFIQNPELFREEEPEADELPSIYPEFEYTGDAWGMSINLNACIGCNACVIACQAENNIPTVGKDQVQNAREMHWLRIDRYYASDRPWDDDDSFDPVWLARTSMDEEGWTAELWIPFAQLRFPATAANWMPW